LNLAGAQFNLADATDLSQVAEACKDNAIFVCIIQP
jgi:hypothetical protein